MNKILFLTLLATVVVAICATPHEVELKKRRGGIRQLKGEDIKDAEEALTFSLNQISADKEGPHYKLLKINSASKQLVSGSLYRIDADLIDNDNEDSTKNCNVKIWSQPWMDNGYEVTFNCGEEESLTRRHSA